VPKLVANRDRSRPNTIPAPHPSGAPVGHGASHGAGHGAGHPGDEMDAIANGALADLTSRNGSPAAASGRRGARPDHGDRAERTEPTALPRAGLPGWLIALTFVCIALFVAGLVVFLRRDTGARAPTGANDAVHTAPGAPGAPVGKAADPVPTSGMILVRKPDGTPWFYVDPQPVSASQFRQLFAKHEQAGAASDPVVMVSYNEARSYAQTLGCRLLTSDEWDSAITTPGVRVAGDLLEWVESPADSKQVRQRGKTLARPDTPQKDITFRMAMRVAQ